MTANDASKTYDGLAYSGGNGVVYTGFVNSETSAVLGGTLAYGGTSQGAINVGSYTIVPSGLTSGNYTITFHNGTLTVNKADQTITFGALADKNMGDADFTVSATASSSLTVSFSTITTTVCTVSAEGSVHLVAIGTCTITAHQVGNGNYNNAPDVPRSFNVAASVDHAPVITEGASINVTMSVNGSPTALQPDPACDGRGWRSPHLEHSHPGCSWPGFSERHGSIQAYCLHPQPFTTLAPIALLSRFRMVMEALPRSQ